ncbi:hypothetical protein JCM18918_4070 [Cutibacterium acnes JCM 18918]|nr:hypothetical protein JCM18918_4070 [Cutibacterium acnes JCM 18918]
MTIRLHNFVISIIFFSNSSPTDRYSDLTNQPLSVGLTILESSIDKVVAWRSPTVNLSCTQS